MAKSVTSRSALLKSSSSPSSTRIAPKKNGESSPPAAQIGKSAKRSQKRAPEPRTDWARLRNMTEEEIEANALSDPDNPPTTKAFWKNARVIRPEKKIPMTVRLDGEVLIWFRSFGKGYQTRINAVLKAYMKAHRRL